MSASAPDSSTMLIVAASRLCIPPLRRALTCWSASLIGVVILAMLVPASTSFVSAQEQALQKESEQSAEAIATLKRFHEYVRDAGELAFDTKISMQSNVGGGNTQATAAFLTRKPNSFRVEAALRGG